MGNITLGDGDGRNRPTPPQVAAAIASEVAEGGPFQCSQCGQRVPAINFVPYLYTYPKPPIRMVPDPNPPTERAEGECGECFKDTTPSSSRGKCVRCEGLWGGYTHCPTCRGRVR